MNPTLRRVTPVLITAAILASGCSVTARAAVGPAAPQASGAGFPASFIGVSPAGTPSRLAAYAASTGRDIKYLTSQQPGGGVSNPALSANGSTVAFERGQGSCARSIDTVPASGGAEQVLIPIRGTGNSAVIPGSPSYSSDGRYLIYDSARCSVPIDETLHVRNLSTGKEQTDPGSFSGLSSRAVFLHADQQVAAIQGGGKLTVWQLPSFAVKAYAAPDGCQYQALAGTETQLIATLQCGSQDTLSLVSVSPATFTVTKTLAHLGSCLGSTDLSLAAGDPTAMLAQTVTACGSPQRVHIVEISGPTVTQVRSGSPVKLPSQLQW